MLIGSFFRRFWPLLTITPVIVYTDFSFQANAAIYFAHPIYNPAQISTGLAIPMICLAILGICLFDSKMITVAVSISLGGFFGNLGARAIYGPVADYFPFPAFLHHPGAQYNLADGCITLGLILTFFAAFLVFCGVGQTTYRQAPRHRRRARRRTRRAYY